MQADLNVTDIVTGSSGPISLDPLASALESLITGYTGLAGLWADALAALAIFAAAIVLSEAARYFVANVAPKLVKSTGSSLDDEVLGAVKGPVQVLILTVGLYLSLKTLDDLPPGVISALDTGAIIVVILVAAYFAGNVIGAVLRWYARDVAPHTGSDLDDNLLPFLRRLLTAVVYALALLLILGRLGIEITALVASLGVAGIAVALAAQETLSNVFGAFAIMTDRPYKVGDRLLIPGVGQGDVIDVGLRSTRVQTLSRTVVVIPNSQMAGAEIVNLSMPDARLRLQIKVGIGYRSDVNRACAIMEEVAAASPLVAPDPKPSAYVSALGDFAVEITMLVWAADYRQELDVPDQIYKEVLRRFREESIEIPYPVMTVLPKAASG
jgi:MscS family membrane protein